MAEHPVAARFTPPRADLPTAAAVVLALAWPTALVWMYFVALAGSPVQQAASVLGHAVQVLFPILFVWCKERRLPWPTRPRREGIALGLGFGALVAAGILALYFGWLRDSSLLATAPQQVRHKLQEFGVVAPLPFLALSLYICTVNALAEEYYFRWFLYGRLRAFFRPAPAIVLAGLGFMAHHVLLLAVYLPGQFWTAVVPLSLCIAVGGGVWAWLYERTGALYAPWLSHALIDGALVVVGWNLLQRGG